METFPQHFNVFKAKLDAESMHKQYRRKIFAILILLVKNVFE